MSTEGIRQVCCHVLTAASADNTISWQPRVQPVQSKIHKISVNIQLECVAHDKPESNSIVVTIINITLMIVLLSLLVNVVVSANVIITATAVALLYSQPGQSRISIHDLLVLASRL